MPSLSKCATYGIESQLGCQAVSKTSSPQRTGSMRLEDQYELPRKQTFPPSAPRYPNLWFFVDAGLAEGYRAAVDLLVHLLKTSSGLIDDFERSNPEGSDDKARVQELQPYEGFDATEFNHDHDLHIRYYYTALEAVGLEGIEIKGRRFHRIASSIHYEVAQKHRYHPYIDPCPICGVTGDYDISGDRCEKIHDPLGLELLLYGTVRGTTATNIRNEPYHALDRIETQYEISIDVAEPARSDINTLRLGCVRISD